MTAPDAGETTDITLPADLSIARIVRGVIRDRMDEWGAPDEAAHRAMVVASELASNALLHAAPPYLLRLSTDGSGVQIAIHDSLVLTPRLRQYDVMALTGRGLQLVADFSRSWGVRALVDGKEVWAEVAFVGDDEPPTAMKTSGPVPAADQPGPAPARQPLVRFLGVPVDAYLALQEWNDAVVRECELIAALQPTPTDLPPRLLELAVRLSGRFATEREGYRDVIALAREEGTTHVDLDGAWVDRSEASADAARAFLAMMEELDAFCRTDVLLAEAPDPIVVGLRRWFVTEMEAQLLRHESPTRFDETDQPNPV